jgi:hypothetical protein
MTVDAIAELVSKLGFPIAAAIFLGITLREVAQWFMRSGDELKARFVLHVDQLDKSQAEIKPQLDRIENKATCRAAALPVVEFPQTATGH